MTVVRTILICLLMLGGSARDALASSSEAQVSAATGNAVDRLISDVLEERIGMDLTVRQFIERTEGLKQLQMVLSGAQPVGGPRWLDEQTCQVKLSIPRERVLDVLRELAEFRPGRSPLPPEALTQQLKDWRGKTFVATGVALSAARARELAPPANALAWQNISEQARRETVLQASSNAAARTLDSLRSVELSPGQPLAGALENSEVRQRLLAYLGEQPVTGVQFRDDLSVETTLRPQTDDLLATLMDTLKAASVTVPQDPAQVERLRLSIDQHLVPAVGRAKADDSVPGSRIMLQSLASERPPAWTRKSVEIIATAAAAESPLKTARQAEDQALAKLREQIGAFSLPGDTTVADQAKQNPAVVRIVDDMMMRARVTKVDYLPDGSASVRLSFDPRDLWDEIQQLP